MSKAIDWMVFDLGGVVLRPTRNVPILASMLGAAPAPVSAGDDESAAAATDHFATSYMDFRLEYDRTSDPARYWRDVAAQCGLPAPSADLTAELTAVDIEGWSHADPDVLSVIADLDRIGVKLAILSNMPTNMAEHLTRHDWIAPFRQVVISGEVGAVKPSPAIYQALLDRIDAPAETVAFTDDVDVNIDGAAALGIAGIRFRGAADLRARLHALGLDL